MTELICNAVREKSKYAVQKVPPLLKIVKVFLNDDFIVHDVHIHTDSQK